LVAQVASGKRLFWEKRKNVQKEKRTLEPRNATIGIEVTEPKRTIR